MLILDCFPVWNVNTWLEKCSDYIAVLCMWNFPPRNHSSSELPTLYNATFTPFILVEPKYPIIPHGSWLHPVWARRSYFLKMTIHILYRPYIKLVIMVAVCLLWCNLFRWAEQTGKRYADSFYSYSHARLLCMLIRPWNWTGKNKSQQQMPSAYPWWITLWLFLKLRRD